MFSEKTTLGNNSPAPRSEGIVEMFRGGLTSLIREWALRAGIWNVGAGAVIGGLLILSCGYSRQIALASDLRRENTERFADDGGRSPSKHNGDSAVAADAGAVAQAETATVEKGWPIRPVESSPRIDALKQRLESGDARALEEFWRDAAQEGTPLIEPANESPGEVVVTFVWRGDSNTQSVGMFARISKSPEFKDLVLRRLLDTDLWYGAWQMRDDLRFTYRFVPNVRSSRTLKQIAVVDPLNPHRMEVAFEGNQIPAWELSIASMPRAPEEQWITKQPDIPAGKVELDSFPSAKLKGKRNIWVYTPPGYSDARDGGYGLLVLFDGFSYLNWIPAPTILDNLIHADEIPPMVLVLIDNPLDSRTLNLGPDPLFGEFVAKELLPWVHEHWNVTRDPKRTIIGGYSAGGSEAATVALRYPELFGNVLSQSGAFGVGGPGAQWEWVSSQYETSRKVALRFFIEAGTLEDVSTRGPNLLVANRNLVKVLKRKGYPVTYEEVGGAHEPVHWRDTLAPGIIALTR
jgi:enterochelin esterase-like enzyme